MLATPAAPSGAPGSGDRWAVLPGRAAVGCVIPGPRPGGRPYPGPVAAPDLLAIAAEVIEVEPVVLELGERFAAAGFEIALVGGSVRDALLGRPGSDLDFTTAARPEQTERVLRGWADAIWDVGRAFGTIGARRGAHALEITTYRSDDYDRASRKPAVVYGNSLGGDLARRDFTINAMALRLPSREFVDPFGGTADLAARVLRTPGSPAVSFGDDPLRMLRAARFASTLGFTVDPAARASATELADRIGIVSAERVRAELEKLLLGADPVAGLRLLVDTGLAAQVLPELPALRLEIDEWARHKDVYEHSLTVLRQAIALEDRLPTGGPDLVNRLSALLHDVGKPKTRRREPGGTVTFHHHDEEGARLVRRRLAALTFPGRIVDDVATLTALHLRFHGYGDGAWTDSAVRRYVRDAGPLLPWLHVLTRADCTTRNARRAARLSAAYDDLEARIAVLAEREELDRIRPALDGVEIMATLGVPPGRVVGRARDFLLEMRLENGLTDPDEARAVLLEWWARENPGT
jgi:poly(A) polymerase